MILGSDNRKKWSSLDILLNLAYQTLQAERCGQCGNYRWICQNSDPKLNVRIKDDYCFVKAELEKEDESRKEKAKGTQLIPEMYHRDDLPLHQLRDSYREQQEEEALENAD